jgi:hypothetical protein
MRRVFMRKTQRHVYYTHDEAGAEIVIHAVWGAPKQHVPTFQRRALSMLTGW